MSRPPSTLYWPFGYSWAGSGSKRPSYSAGGRGFIFSAIHGALCWHPEAAAIHGLGHRLGMSSNIHTRSTRRLLSHSYRHNSPSYTLTHCIKRTVSMACDVFSNKLPASWLYLTGKLSQIEEKHLSQNTLLHLIVVEYVCLSVLPKSWVTLL
jgi:hypothetical protein